MLEMASGLHSDYTDCNRLTLTMIHAAAHQHA